MKNLYTHTKNKSVTSQT